MTVLRALRVLRVLRLLTMVPSMRRVVGALLAARDHIEADLHAEMRQLREEIQALQITLAVKASRPG